MKRRQRACQQAGDFLATQDNRQLLGLLGVRCFLYAPVPLQRFVEKETESADPLIDGVGGEMPLPEQIRLVLADVFRAKLFSGPIEMPAQIRNRAQVGARGSLRVIPPLEFLEQQRL